MRTSGADTLPKEEPWLPWRNADAPSGFAVARSAATAADLRCIVQNSPARQVESHLPLEGFALISQKLLRPTMQHQRTLRLFYTQPNIANEDAWFASLIKNTDTFGKL